MAKRYIGGYAILDLTSGSLYNDALALANVDKPILVYPENDKPVFADTFTIDSDNDLVIITIGGLTITIDDTNAVSIVGDITNHLYELTINAGDDNLSILTTKKLEDYIILDTTSLTDNDKNYLHSLLPLFHDGIGFKYGHDGLIESNPIAVGGFYNKKLYLTMDMTEFEFDLENPTNQSDNNTLKFIFNQIL